MVSEWVLTVGALAVFVGGVNQAVTGRILFNHAPISWSNGEIRIYGLSFAVLGLLMAVGVLTWSGLAPEALIPSRWGVLWFPAMILTMPATQILLERHHDHRWPFKSAASPL